MSGTESTLDTLYDALARYVWLVRRLRHTPAGSGLEVHKRLAPPEPGAAGPRGGVAGLAPWLLAIAQPLPAGRLVELGCGFGPALLDLVARTGRDGVGITKSAFQIAKAQAEAGRRGLAAACTFRCQSYDEPLEGGGALVFAIEALFHAEDLAHTVAGVHAALVPGGRFVICEDMLVDAAARSHPAAAMLATTWCTPRLHTSADYDEALATRGFIRLSDHDLTVQVRPSTERLLKRRDCALTLLSRLLPSRAARAVARAFRGGVALERLYAAGLVHYRVLVVERGTTGC